MLEPVADPSPLKIPLFGIYGGGGEGEGHPTSASDKNKENVIINVLIKMLLDISKARFVMKWAGGANCRDFILIRLL